MKIKDRDAEKRPPHLENKMFKVKLMSELTSPDLLETWIVQLQNNGYRLTEPRRAVLETIAASQQVLSPLDIYERARARHAKLGLVTVYRTVEKMEALDLIQRVHRPSGCQAFIASAPGHQHLLICQKCGRVEYFSGDRLETLIAEVAGESGYKIRNHWLQLFGLCAHCQKNSPPEAFPGDQEKI